MGRAALVALALLVVGCGGGPPKNVEQENGLLGLQLGADPATVPGLVKLKESDDGDVVWYEPDAHRYWGPAPISARCHEWRGQIWKIELRTGNSKGLLPEVTREFGTPSYATPWQWDGPTVRMNFQGTEYDSTAVLTLVKKPLAEARERAQQGGT
jgi:hypothetical protein